MKLYASLTSPFARKIRILVAEKSIPCELVVDDPNAPNSPVSGLNPLGKVPVMLRDDGSALFDSPVILEWLDRSRSPALIPAEGEERWQVLREVTLPVLFPGLFSGALFAFLLSWGNFPLSLYTTGADTTVPEYLYAKMVAGYTPGVPVL